MPVSPDPDGESRRRLARLARLAFILPALGLITFAAHALFGFGGDASDDFFNNVLYNALLIWAAGACILRGMLVAEERPAWLVLGGGMLAWSFGDIYFTLNFSGLPSDDIPFPSKADAMYLVFYPAAYAAMVLLIRSRVREFHASTWLDGAIGASAVAALGAALLSGAVLRSTGGDVATVATNLAYPMGDLLLLGFVAGVFALTGWKPGWSWSLIGAGIACSAVADVLYLYKTAGGTYVEGTILDAFWPAGLLLLSYAAWGRTPRQRPLDLSGGRMLVVPCVFAMVAIGLEVYDHFHQLSHVALAASTATLVLVVIRMAMTFRENLGMLDTSRRLSNTDPLTDLGNRRALMRDLDEELAIARHEAPLMLVIFDMNGFKAYNDSYGHPAGDALLSRLGGSLQEAVEPEGRAYRLGGDEFCVLTRTDGSRAEPMLAAAAVALSERGEGFRVASSYGAVILPQEAETASHAMRLADRRMYAQKDQGRASARRQTRDVLLNALRERDPQLATHLQDVSGLAVAIARRLGLPPEDLDVVGRAAELHDVGKVAIPDAILKKPGPLDESEWAFIRTHTVIGERILDSAPALVPVAKLVRSSHERWDGAGYPDGLSGEAIPLGSRIVAVCDAFDAMTTSRAYRNRLTIDEALGELRRCAGTQFDPAVVEAISKLSEANPLLLLGPGTDDGPAGDPLAISGPVLEQLRSALEHVPTPV